MSSAFPHMTLFGHARFRSFRNVWMLEEIVDNVPGFVYEHNHTMPRSAEVTTVNPMGKIPALRVKEVAKEGHEEMEEYVLFESAAINTWLGDRMGSHCAEQRTRCLVPAPGSAARACYESFCYLLMSEMDAQGLWLHRKHASLGHIFGAYPDAVAAARSQFERAMVVVKEQLEKQKEKVGENYYLIGAVFTAADILLVHCCNWAEAIDVRVERADGEVTSEGQEPELVPGGWFAKFREEPIFVDYLQRLKVRPAYLRAVEKKSIES